MEPTAAIKSETGGPETGAATPAGALLNQSQYAAHRGLSQPRVAQLIKTGQLDGAFSVTDTGRYLIDAAAADALLDATRNESLDQQRNLFTGEVNGNAGVKRPQPVSRLPHTLSRKNRQPRTFSEANTLERTYKAKMAQLKYEEQAGALVNRDEMEKQGMAVGKLIRARLEAIPARLAPTVAGLSDPVDVAERLKVEINLLLTDLANDVSNIPFG